MRQQLLRAVTYASGAGTQPASSPATTGPLAHLYTSSTALMSPSARLTVALTRMSRPGCGAAPPPLEASRTKGPLGSASELGAPGVGLASSAYRWPPLAGRPKLAPLGSLRGSARCGGVLGTWQAVAA